MSPRLRKFLSLGWIGWMFMVLLWGCKPRTEAPSTFVAPAGVQVQSVEVVLRGSTPPQVSAIIRGNLPDPCTAFSDMQVVRQDNVFFVQLQTQALSTGCPATPTPFEISVALPVEGLTPGTYTVNVHGVTGTFVFAQEAQGPTAARPSTAPAPAASPGTPTGPVGATPVATTAPAKGTITGLVWEDRCQMQGGEGGAPLTPGPNCRLYPGLGYAADGQRQPDEPGLADVSVQLWQGSCPGEALVVQAHTDGQGRFTFANLEPGAYCVVIDATASGNDRRLIPGVWTQPLVGEDEVARQTVTVAAGTTREVTFGRYLSAVGFVGGQPTATPTLDIAPELASLGAPTMRDPMNSAAKWYMLDEAEARFEMQDGRLVMYAYDPGYINYWGLSAYPELDDAYLQGTFITGPTCQDRDRYGFIVRAPSPKYGVVVLLSCQGEYMAFRWDGEYHSLVPWTKAEPIRPGPNLTNQLGLWMEGSTFKIYVNGKLVGQFTDTTWASGRFGLVVGSGSTVGFQVAVDEVRYWILP